jgi:phosphoribulokinase
VPMLAIAGDSATGKTTLSHGLAKALGPEKITWMCTDDYHKYDRQERKDLPFTPLHPDCNYLEIMEQHLQLLTLGQPILKPIYNHDTGTLDRPVLVHPAQYVIVDGLFPLWSKLSRACFDVTVFLDPPEHIRRQWKVYRDVTKRGYTEEQVLRDLDKREPESEAYIRPQRKHADIVIRFAPVEGAADSKALSATILLRPTIPHPDLSDVLSNDSKGALHMKLIRDDDGKPVDAIHVHGHANREASREVEEAIWSKLGIDAPVPDCLGEIEGGKRSEPLAIAQLILLYHLLLVS